MSKLDDDLVNSVFFVVRENDRTAIGSGFIVKRGSDAMPGQLHPMLSTSRRFI